MGGERIAPPFFTSAKYGGEWSASRPDPFTPGERAGSTHWIGDWLGSIVGVDATDDNNNNHNNNNKPSSNPACPERSLSLYSMSYPGSPMLHDNTFKGITDSNPVSNKIWKKGY
jgi:hypothetical protein